MRVHAFLAAPAELRRVVDGPTPPARGAPLNGVDPANLASLVEIATSGAITAEEAEAGLAETVLTAAGLRVSIHVLPAEATEALGAADAGELARWAEEWTGDNGRPDNGPGKALRALAELAARRQPEQSLYLWVADGA
jgi:hypothetical protein